MSEDARHKGLRLLVDGRLTIHEVDPVTGFIYATCKGDNALYHLGYDPARKELRCNCQARTKCSHLWALTTVTLPPESDAPNVTVASRSPEPQTAPLIPHASNAWVPVSASKP